MKFSFSFGFFLLFYCVVFTQTPNTSSSQFNVIRFENEIKLSVPNEIADSVWQYIASKYGNSKLFLKGFKHSFHTRTEEELFVDQYFDNADMQLLEMQCGVRHRTRYIIADSINPNNKQELMQIKINDVDDNGLNRAEYKYLIKYSGKPNNALDIHPFFYNVHRDHRKALAERLSAYNINSLDLVPTILLEQLRKRIYISRNLSGFATLTLDFVTSKYEGKVEKFVELELESNEIKYTRGDSTTRAQMENLNSMIKSDLLNTFPSIKQDQTPKYNKAFIALGLRDFKYRPIFGLSDIQLTIGVSLIVALLTVIYLIRVNNENQRNHVINPD